MSELREIIELVESWRMMRETGREFAQKDLNKFVDNMNGHTRRLISAFGRTDTAFYDALTELATHAQSVTTKGAKTYVNKQHHTTN